LLVVRSARSRVVSPAGFKIELPRKEPAKPCHACDWVTKSSKVERLFLEWSWLSTHDKLECLSSSLGHWCPTLPNLQTLVLDNRNKNLRGHSIEKDSDWSENKFQTLLLNIGKSCQSLICLEVWNGDGNFEHPITHTPIISRELAKLRLHFDNWLEDKIPFQLLPFGSRL
jgi:hypothetical protein